MVTPAARRAVVGGMTLERAGVSQRLICRVLGWSRTSVRYKCRKNDGDPAATLLKELALKHPAWGYRMLYREIRRQGVRISRRRLLALYTEAGLAHRRRKVAKRSRPAPVRPPRRAAAPNEIWAVDFMSDQLANGRRIRLLVVIDEFTRELLTLSVAWSFDGDAVAKHLDELVRERGAPKCLRSDNGSEFVGNAMKQWRTARGVEPILSRPGKPVDNAICESNNGRIRAEFLNTTIFDNLPRTAEKAAQYRLDFNNDRPHSALGGLTPTIFAARHRNSRDTWT